MIQVEQLEFKYPKSDKVTLKGLNFEINNGEIFGFLGPSGAGKSTTQKVLYKILSGYNGSVIIDGKNIKEWDNSYFEKIGVGFELPNHYLKLTGKENMDLFASFYKKGSVSNVEELFEIVDLNDAMNKPVETYSKGMKIRLNFIRAVQHNPDILFFDEPTSGLDPVNAHKIKQQILDLKAQGKTIFITTHAMDIADQLCDRVSFIVDGYLKATDTPLNLKKEYGKEAVNVELTNGAVQEFPLINLGINSAFLNFIKQEEIKRIHTLEATLEEVFIKITGKSLII
ncbi:ABC-type multidrug transport system, ATPase component [Aequorivita sublithincola DSM 14238]|uniref:ABC-type multidrug transport system, ATPase component n=1 Tax=Aequorivita sublithincola (strain DSM 14238 / LMG 21431 / ACAM 643 / 9-3) TaxID=746697 RepID=I3Z012_AEQSU|nr:ABC transporter ATP-binding protein [Aequorivita sublithincola]AFL82580.1 ABC-type multidrug transport system, ATPase component [Aequorivita sublithincola DSM 14238]